MITTALMPEPPEDNNEKKVVNLEASNPYSNLQSLQDFYMGTDIETFLKNNLKNHGN